MQFALLIYQGSAPLPNTDEWNALSPQEQRSIYADYQALNQLPGCTPGLPLGLPERATTVRVDGGSTVAGGGAYMGKEGAVGGYLVVEADDLDAAIAIPAKIPAARLGGAVEVRPVETYW